MGRLLVKDGVAFGTNLAFAGARILDRLKWLVAGYPFDVTITSSRDGTHAGPDDPHYSGEAFDLRTHTLTNAQKVRLLTDLQESLYKTPRKFFAFLEASGSANEHIHVQRRNGVIYTADDYLNNR